MITLQVTVDDIDAIIAAGYTLIRVYTDTSSTGNFTTLDGTITLVADTAGYSYTDTDGTTSTWYKTAYYGASPGESDKSDAQQGGTMDAYCTALDVRVELAAGSGASDISEKWDNVIWEMCLEASRLIDEYKVLEDGAYLASGSEARYFDGTGDRHLWIRESPATSITAVEVEETDATWTTWSSSDYWTVPYNDTPIVMLEVSDRSASTKSAWTEGPKRVRLTGVWGWSTSVPSLIRRACVIQVAQWYKRAMAGWQEDEGATEFGILRYPRALSTDVMAILDQAKPRATILL